MMFRCTVLAILPMLAAPPALAHAQLQSADPAVGSTVAAAPAMIALTFSEALETRFSTVVVTDTRGARVDRNDLAVAPGDGMTVRIDLQPIKAGTYTVTWHAVSVDTHKTQGSYRFTVGP